MMDEWGYGHSYSNDLGGLIFMLIVVALLVVGVALVVRSLNNQNQAGRSSQDDAMSILKKRYAAGDIDKKEFEEKKKALTE